MTIIRHRGPVRVPHPRDRTPREGPGGSFGKAWYQALHGMKDNWISPLRGRQGTPCPAGPARGRHGVRAVLLGTVLALLLMPSTLRAGPPEDPRPGGGASPVIVVSSLDPEMLAAAAKEIRKKAPGVEFRYYPDEARLLSQIRARSVTPDVYFGTTTVFLARLADKGFLDPRDTTFADRLPVGMADRERRWYGVLGNALAVVYNSDYYADPELKRYLPKRWTDLALPRYKGSLLLEYPSPYNATGYLFACLVDRAERGEGDRRKGFSILEGYDRNLYRVEGKEPSFRTRKNILSRSGLFSGGDGSITVAALRDVERAAEEDLPVDFIQPQEGLVIHPRGLGLRKDAPPQAQRVYDLLADEAFLVRFARRYACVPIAAGGEFTVTVWPGEPTSFDIMHTDHDAVLRNLDTWLGEWHSLYKGRTLRKLRSIDNALNTTMTFLIPAALLFHGRLFLQIRPGPHRPSGDGRPRARAIQRRFPRRGGAL